MDFCCKKIANAVLLLLLQADGAHGTTQARLAKAAGLGRPTVIHHLKHLEKNSFVLKGRIRTNPLGGPGWLYKPSPKLLEIGAAGKTLSSLADSPEGSDAAAATRS